MTEDQWRPFAVWMRQSRLRALSVYHQVPYNQLIMIVSGEGGTGKSWLIRQIILDIKIVCGSNQAKKHILLMAYQGSAAYFIVGRTIPSSLALPGQCNFRTSYVLLVATPSDQTSLRRFQNELEQVHTILIDEFGVISCGMLHWIDQRLR